MMALTAKASSVIVLNSAIERTAHIRCSPMSFVLLSEAAGRYTAPLCGRTVSWCAIAKSLPRILSSSQISVTIKFQIIVCVPRVTASLARPMDSSVGPSTEHSQLQYFLSSSSRHPHFFKTRVVKIDTTDPVSPKKLTKLPATHPGRYSPFPTAYIPSFAVPLLGPASIVTPATVCFLNASPCPWSGTPVRSGPFVGTCGTPYRLSVDGPPAARPSPSGRSPHRVLQDARLAQFSRYIAPEFPQSLTPSPGFCILVRHISVVAPCQPLLGIHGVLLSLDWHNHSNNKPCVEMKAG